MQKTKIEWCNYTFNPVTGCLHGCPYCYARNITHRFAFRMYTLDGLGEMQRYGKECECKTLHDYYKKPENSYPYGFDPTFHRYRLDEPQRIKKPQNIFVCSMADLFGAWVPNEWIKEVFEACKKAPWHRYLFLTKNPKRYEQFIDMPMPENMWFGFSQTKRENIGFNTHASWNVFVSMEPLLERLDNAMPEEIKWAIIGAESGNRKDKVIPERAWIEDIVKTCRENNIPIFMKDSLSEIWGEPLIREYPWLQGESDGR